MDAICCVCEYWHLKAEMCGMKQVEGFLENVLNSSKLTFNGNYLDVQWVEDRESIYFGGTSNLYNEEIIRSMIKQNQKTSIIKFSEWCDTAFNTGRDNKRYLTRFMNRVTKLKFFRQKYRMQTVTICSYNIEWLQND